MLMWCLLGPEKHRFTDGTILPFDLRAIKEEGDNDGSECSDFSSETWFKNTKSCMCTGHKSINVVLHSAVIPKVTSWVGDGVHNLKDFTTVHKSY